MDVAQKRKRYREELDAYCGELVPLFVASIWKRKRAERLPYEKLLLHRAAHAFSWCRGLLQAQYSLSDHEYVPHEAEVVYRRTVDEYNWRRRESLLVLAGVLRRRRHVFGRDVVVLLMRTCYQVSELDERRDVVTIMARVYCTGDTWPGSHLVH